MAKISEAQRKHFVNRIQTVESLRQLEAARSQVASRLQANCRKIQDILKEAGHISQFEEVHFWDSDDASKYEHNFRKFCNITCSQNNQGGISDEISKLENKRDEAIDFLYGLSEESELMHGVSKILEGTNVKLIG